MRYRPSTLSIGQQITQMRRHFPAFRYRLETHRQKHVPTWRGRLQPTEVSPVYQVQIQYAYPRSPRIWVPSPALRSDAPHRYGDGSLCLYYPGDGSWTPALPIAQTLVPWTALWLAFYEIWLRTGTWYGSEAPHAQAKEKA
jgi:hypothetical protein